MTTYFWPRPQAVGGRAGCLLGYPYLHGHAVADGVGDRDLAGASADGLHLVCHCHSRTTARHPAIRPQCAELLGFVRAEYAGEKGRDLSGRYDPSQRRRTRQADEPDVPVGPGREPDSFKPSPYSDEALHRAQSRLGVGDGPDDPILLLQGVQLVCTGEARDHDLTVSPTRDV